MPICARRRSRLTFAITACFVASALAPVGYASAQPSATPGELRVTSPNGRTEVSVALTEGHLTYAVRHDARAILLPSKLGFAFRNAAPLGDGLQLVTSVRAAVDTTWTQPWGEVARVRDHHRELRITVAETAAPGRLFTVVFRVFDDGLGFRYELPQQANLGAFEISDELTEFAMADNAKAWWIPGNRKAMDRYEFLYASSPVSMLDTVRTALTYRRCSA